MLTIRFARHGRKKQAFFKLVIAEKARAVQKKIVEELGHFDPLANAGKGSFTFDAEAIKKYIKNGAQVSQSAARLLVKNGVNEAEKFIEIRASKPKKEVPAAAPVEEPADEANEEAASSEEVAAEETPAE